MRPPVFFDTNVLIYTLSADTVKAGRAQSLLRSGGHISVQVLNEFAHAGLRKLKLPLVEIEAVMKATLLTCDLHDLKLGDTVAALTLAGRHGFPFYDSVIAASALRAGCTTLWTEDFQHGMKVEGKLTIRNPFRTE